MIITLSGRPGSGKSTVAKLVAQKLGLKHYSTGDFMRQLAVERNVLLRDLTKQAEQSKEIDTILDRRQIELGQKEDNFVIDGRLSFHFIPKSIKIFLDADIKERARRIHQMGRKEEPMADLDDAVKKLQEREESEKLRYKRYYGIDLGDKKNYDMAIDTTFIPAEKVAEKIVEFVKGKMQTAYFK